MLPRIRLRISEGMWGSSDHLQELANTIREVHSKPQGSISTALGPDIELDVLLAQSNQSAQTYDGIDWGAERVIQEVRATSPMSKRYTTDFSFLSRYASEFKTCNPVVAKSPSSPSRATVLAA